MQALRGPTHIVLAFHETARGFQQCGSMAFVVGCQLRYRGVGECLSVELALRLVEDVNQNVIFEAIG